MFNSTEKYFWKNEVIKITVLYIFMLAGGLWHLLNVLQEVMRQMAVVTIAAVSFWLIYELWRFKQDKKLFRQSLYWLSLVFIISMLVETIGVRSGQVFGPYIYGDTLRPFIGDVPLAIGFAWINMLLTSAAVAELLLNNSFTKHATLSVLLIAILMVIFDAIMEPAAAKLGYWTWINGEIPFKNYFAWFVLALGFSALGMRMSVFKAGMPGVMRHAYFAQLGYFFLVNLK